MYTIVDTGSTAILISALYFESLLEEIFSYAGISDWQLEDGYVYTRCEDHMPSLFFQMDGAWIEARPEDYVYDRYGDGSECMLFLAPSNSPMNIFGMPIFVDYYSIHEPRENKITWALHTNSAKQEIIKGTRYFA